MRQFLKKEERKKEEIVLEEEEKEKRISTCNIQASELQFLLTPIFWVSFN